MNLSFWSSSKSVTLSRVLTLLFAVALVIIDIFAVPFTNLAIVTVFLQNKGLAGGYLLLANLYLCSIPGYLLLYSLYRLLQNMERIQVFVAQNITYLRRVSWCCWCAAVLCGITAFVWSSHGVISLAAAFVGLIVRVVKNAFEQAILMKDELDFTV